MIIRPRVRGFVCVTAHPAGCAAHVQEQIDIVQKQGPIAQGPKRVLVLGASTGYGLASRITAAFASGAATIGVFFERPANNGRPASAGWYNSVAFEQQAQQAGLYAHSINGDAFTPEIRQQTVDLIKADLGSVDLVVYSLAAPRRTDPVDGTTHRSVLKPIGDSCTAKTLDTDRGIVHEITLEPATNEDIADTTKVMGGEDWELWIAALQEAGVLADGATTVAYSYIGPKVTWPIYYHGTIGRAKEDLQRAAAAIDSRLAPTGGRAFVSVNKAVVTQASSAIPVVPLYLSILLKVMKEQGNHEDCIEQIYRLFSTQMYNNKTLNRDEQGRARVDDWELSPAVQTAVMQLWPQVTTETLPDLTDFAGYQANFLKLFGFGLPGVNYEQEVDIEVELPSLALAGPSR